MLFRSHSFVSNFRVLPLGVYDGILGLDWLTIHSPMIVDWKHKCLSFKKDGTAITLQGVFSPMSDLTMVAVASLISSDEIPIPEVIQPVIDQFVGVFSPPEGLPPRRLDDHTIPLIPGARPVAIRPYRIAPHLKTELEKQIAELLQNGMIRHSNSAFSSPVLLVKKEEIGRAHV